MLWEVPLLGKLERVFCIAMFWFWFMSFCLGLVVIANDGDERPLSFSVVESIGSVSYNPFVHLIYLAAS